VTHAGAPVHRSASPGTQFPATTARPPAVQVQGLTKSYGPTLALNDVTLEITSGETRGLIGRNGAGKSTLVKLVTGLEEPAAGTIRLHGQPGPSLRDHHAWRSLVGTVHQHSTLQQHLSVAENLFIGDLPTTRAGTVSWRRAQAMARAVLDEWEIDVRETQQVGELTLAERQLIEIARELSRGVGIVILDEPTSRLANAEIERLYRHMARLRDQGITVIYISHHLAEVMTLCDSVTVLKDGCMVATRVVAETNTGTLIADMVGDESRIGEQAHPGARRVRTTEQRLSVREIAAHGLEPISFEICRGEVVGVAGLVGSGKEVLAQVLAGTLPPDDGDVGVDGRTLNRTGVADLINAGIATVPGDRHRQGQVAEMGIGENVTMSIARRMANRLGFIAPERRNEVATGLMRDVGMVASSPAQPARSLSGGNQQKGVIARALATDPSVLVLLQPTTGVDVASKAAIFEVIARECDRGMAVLLISDELEEYELCDRVLVLFQGRLAATFTAPLNASDLLSAIEGVPH
jgi:simple sugar transport system ATP-binding protein